MTYQTQSNGYVAYKAQSGLGVPASGSGASVLRTSGGAGGRLTKASTESNEVRRDGMRNRGRHGNQKTAGPYTAEMSLGLMDDIVEAIVRDTWQAPLVITEATGGLTSITTGANTIVNGGGSWITSGIRVGDVLRLTGHSSAGNNSRNLRVTGVTSSTITVAETLTVNAVADTSFTITRPRKLTQYNGGALIKRYFTIEEHELDIDGSEIFSDCVWNSLRIAMAPNGIVSMDPAWVGTGQFQIQTGGSAPMFTSPTEPTGVPMAAADATIRFNTGDVLDLTAFELTIDIGATSPDVVASRYAPDVFSGQMSVGLSLTALRQDLQYVTNFLNETPCSLHFLAVENETEPKDFVSVYVPNFTLGTVDKSAPSREGGPRTQTIAIPAALVGKDLTGGAFDPTMVKIQVSN